MAMSVVELEEELLFAAQVQRSFCETTIVMRMMMPMCVVVALLCI